MSLNLDKLTNQITGMVANLREKAGEKQEKLSLALQTLELQAPHFVDLQKKIESAKTTWLVAGLNEKIDRRIPAIQCPDDYIVVASDGSHIDVDRHHSAHCFLINIGLVQLQYGKYPDAWLSSFPSLYFKDDEIAFFTAEGLRIPIEGQLLGLKRSVEECRMLVDRATGLQTDLPAIALLDGSLVLWGLMGQTYSDSIIQTVLVEGILQSLDKLSTIGQDHKTGLASYISFPRSTEIVNVMRLAVCPYQPVDCDYYCSGKSEGRECDVVGGLLDRDIFNQLLEHGERSALFSSRSSIVDRYYGPHKIYFFYSKVDDEVARVEMPGWVAANEVLLNTVHSVVVDQCRRGLGYPVALSEAHEQAVVTGVEREQFWRLVDLLLAENRIELKTSAKQQSKRMRWI